MAAFDASEKRFIMKKNALSIRAQRYLSETQNRRKIRLAMGTNILVNYLLLTYRLHVTCSISIKKVPIFFKYSKYSGIGKVRFVDTIYL